jgi:hypothetical protein
MLTGPRRKASDAQGRAAVDAAPADLVPTRYTIGLSAGAPSVLLPAAAGHATAETAGKAALHA